MSNDIISSINALIESRKSLLIASLNEANLPEISATPFLKQGNSFFIFVSELATHTQNFRQRPDVNVMLIADEHDTKNAFTRKRLSYACTAACIPRNDKNWKPILKKFEAKQGKTVTLLKQLNDFHLFELKASSGSYIEGFGKAYKLSGDQLNHIEQQTAK